MGNEKTKKLSLAKPEDATSPQRKSNVVLSMALTATFAVIALFGGTLLFLQLKFTEPIKITIADWLKLFVPIVSGAIVVIFAFLGVNRLKDFDERQDKLSKELRDDLNDRVDSSLQLAEPRLNEVYEKWNAALKTKLAGYDESFGIIEDSIKKYDRVFSSVKKLEEVIDAVGNVEEAHKFIIELYHDEKTNKVQRTRFLVTLVERVKSGDLKGDSADYHNIAIELANQNYYEFAADITRKGLEIFGDNIDLLSDFLYYSHKAGRTKDVDFGIGKLTCIEKNAWNWRAFTFYIDVMNDREATKANREKTLFCVAEYKRVLPDEERAYMAEYETYKKYGDLDKAEEALVEAERKLAMTAQCSLALSQIFHMRGEYGNAIRSASLAIIGQAETQPSSSTGAAFAQRALSTDAKLNKAVLEGDQIENHYDEINSAIYDYNMAIQCGFGRQNILTRKKILVSLLPNDMGEDRVRSDFEERLEKLEKAVTVFYKIITSNDKEKE